MHPPLPPSDGKQPAPTEPVTVKNTRKEALRLEQAQFRPKDVFVYTSSSGMETVLNSLARMYLQPWFSVGRNVNDDV